MLTRLRCREATCKRPPVSKDPFPHLGQGVVRAWVTCEDMHTGDQEAHAVQMQADQSTHCTHSPIKHHVVCIQRRPTAHAGGGGGSQNYQHN